MNTYHSPAFATAKQAHDAAYAIHEAFAEAGDDGTQLGGTKESDGASEAEYRALDAMFETPALTPGDLLHKFAIYSDRQMAGWTGDRDPCAASRYTGILKNDLAAMAQAQTAFDAEDWITTMRALGHAFSVILDGNQRHFSRDVDAPDGLRGGDLDRFRIYEAMLHGEGHKERCKAVADRIQSHHPDYFIDLTGRGVDTAGVAEVVGAVAA